MKFKEILSKLNEKNEEGKPETTKKFASETPGQEELSVNKESNFDTDIQYDGAKVADDLDPITGAKTDTKKSLAGMIKKGAAESASKKKATYEGYIPEKLTLDDPVGTWIKDFQKSDAPQFAGKSADERKKMALAAYYSRQKQDESIYEETLDLSEDQAEEWKRIQSMDKGSLTGDKDGVRKKLSYLNAVLAFQRKHGKDTLKVKKDIERINRSKLAEEDKMKGEDPCWDDYEMVGHKMKNGKKVPNCVPKEEVDHVAEGKNHNGVEVSNIEPGDQITWWYNKFHPNYVGIVRRVEGKYLVVYATGAGQLYRIEKSDVRSLKKGVAEASLEEVEQISESEDKTISRLKQLVRFGLMDKSKLPVLSRAMKSLEKGQVTNPSERTTLFELLNELIGLITGDDAMFAKVRMNVQKEEVELDERNKENALKRKSMDASRGASFKARGNVVPDRGAQHKTAQAHNKAIGRALRNEDTVIEEQAPEAPSLMKHRIAVTVSDPDHTMVSKRNEKIQKFVVVTHSDNKDGAKKVGEKYYTKKGYKVHGSEHVGMVK